MYHKPNVKSPVLWRKSKNSNKDSKLEFNDSVWKKIEKEKKKLGNLKYWNEQKDFKVKVIWRIKSILGRGWGWGGRIN